MKSKQIHSTHFLSTHAVLLGLVIRLVLAWFLPWLLDDERLIPGVAYTDIDYHVYTDAALHIKNGRSPYNRLTYRYTPFLAAFLSVLPHRSHGRYLFCLADVCCGWLIVCFRRNHRRSRTVSPDTGIPAISHELMDALWWLYNPLAINICTRGSAESLIVLLPVLLTIWTISRGHKTCSSAFIAGLCHGVAIHSKLYPIIYSLSFMTCYATLDLSMASRIGQAGFFGEAMGLLTACFIWLKRLIKPAPIIFGLASLSTFALLSLLAYHNYGYVALEEGLYYHFSRVDHRHNYSMHWYWIYLARFLGNSNMAIVGRLLILPQALLLLYTSLRVAPINLNLALFVQTFAFVSLNKVITAQYFTWFLCLLPLASDAVSWESVVPAIGILLVSIGGWLGSAYSLEMMGMAVHSVVWINSVLFFLANVNLLGVLIRATNLDCGVGPLGASTQHQDGKTKKS